MLQTKMNKKAISFDMLQWMMRLLFLTVVIFSVVLLLNAYTTKKLDVKELQAEILINRLILSPDGISKYDYVSGRSIPLVIEDLSLQESKDKMEQKLMQTINYDKKNFIAAQMEIFENQEIILVTFYYDKATYENIAPRTWMEGIGGALKYERIFPVIYKDKSAYMKISAVVSNS